MFSKRFQEWYGITLMGAILVATLWLAGHDMLQLYIHPRYQHFTVILALIGLIAIGASLAIRQPPTHDHTVAFTSKCKQILGRCFVIFCCICAVFLPPATLSSITASQRGLNSTVVDTISARPTHLGDSTDFRSFSIKEWASLLAVTDPTFFTGKPVAVTGFVYAGEQPSPNVFYISRFQITCCAVDAQPKGLPVYMPNWQSTYHTDQWVTITGTFITQHQSPQTLIKPTQILPVEQPKDPYDY